MGKIALIDSFGGQDDEHVRCAELVIDDRPVSDIGADAQIALDKRR